MVKFMRQFRSVVLKVVDIYPQGTQLDHPRGWQIFPESNGVTKLPISSNHIFGLCITFSRISSKNTQIYFDTYFPYISHCCFRPRFKETCIL